MGGRNIAEAEEFYRDLFGFEKSSPSHPNDSQTRFRVVPARRIVAARNALTRVAPERWGAILARSYGSCQLE